MSSLKMICSDNECRSENVTVDASARWDKHKEQWVIEEGSEYPKNGYCYDCGEHTSVQEMRQEKVQNKAIPLNIDEWKYFHDATGQGIVVNAWIDDSDDELMVSAYVVPQEKAINNDWHNDMEAIQECSHD